MFGFSAYGYNIFLFIFTHNITTQYLFKTNKTQQNNKRILLIPKVQSKGRERKKHNKSFHYIITYIRGKTLPSINSGRLAPIDSCCCTFTSYYLQEAIDPICFSTHVSMCKPVLYYCLFRCRKTSKQHSLLY